MTDGITEAIAVAEPQIAKETDIGRDATKAVIFGLAGFADKVLESQAFRKLIGINNPMSSTNHMVRTDSPHI